MAPQESDGTWIIQRCTQEWRGTELLYVDFPTPEGIMTREQMVVVLERVSLDHPNHEFKGHNLVQYRSLSPKDRS